MSESRRITPWSDITAEKVTALIQIEPGEVYIGIKDKDGAHRLVAASEIVIAIEKIRDYFLTPFKGGQ